MQANCHTQPHLMHKLTLALACSAPQAQVTCPCCGSSVCCQATDAMLVHRQGTCMCSDNPQHPPSIVLACSSAATAFMGCIANSQPCPNSATATTTLQSHFVSYWPLHLHSYTRQDGTRDSPGRYRLLHHSSWLSWALAVTAYCSSSESSSSCS